MGASHFSDLDCWRLADELKAAVYEIIATPQVMQDRDFCHDIRRSSRSAPANISEGFGRFTHREFALLVHCSSIARRNRKSPAASSRRWTARPGTMESSHGTGSQGTEGNIETSNSSSENTRSAT
jgi:hypothetical protein